MDIYTEKNLSPMLLGSSEPFDDKDYIYELKLDGIRCLAYLSDTTSLSNKRLKDVTDTYPELKYIHTKAIEPCVIDGELVILVEGNPDFYQLQKRSLMKDRNKISIQSRLNPVHFVAYDILYINNTNLADKPLIERKKILTNNVQEGSLLSISRFIEERGTDFFNLARDKNLEGVVAKHINSKYLYGKRTNKWSKFKVLNDIDLIIWGFTLDDNDRIKSLKLCGYYENQLISQGSVSLGIDNEAQNIILDYARNNLSSPHIDSKEDITWIRPHLVCSIQYMEKTIHGLRQPIFKRLVDDKSAKQCFIEN